MACSNCKCDTPRDKTPEEVNAEKFEALEREVRAINEFLSTKYQDLIVNGDMPIRCLDWSTNEAMKRARDHRILQAISRLEQLGYVVAKPEPPSEPTLESAIRDVVITNSQVK